ncbi:hypothetical protein CesoFtcFv8_020469 [Champsocephalus esox]|uniref:Uncharacterized protein n=1 Tax=Champsocephalus esox TaxID=159716 RepID=A0AAN8GK47_9TELE|nr:hypothetical protein CesoFtcFv8_020469 [Champsocephalus esox]
MSTLRTQDEGVPESLRAGRSPHGEGSEALSVKGCEATAECTEIIDTMNGRNPRAKGFKSPSGALKWRERKAFLSRAGRNLLTLETKDGAPLHRSKRSIQIVLVIHA